MDTFSPVVPAVRSRFRRLVLVSATALVAVSTSFALPKAGATNDESETPYSIATEMSAALVNTRATVTQTASEGEITPAPTISVATPTTAPTSFVKAPFVTAPPSVFATPAVANNTNPSDTPSVKGTVATTTAPKAGPASNNDAQAAPVKDAVPASVQWTPGSTVKLVTTGLNQAGGINIDVNRTTELKSNAPVKRVSIAQPEIADVQAFADNLLLVTAKKAGSTQVMIWDENNQSQSIDVNVEVPLDQLKDLIAKLAPGSNVEISVANDTIVLRGQAPNLTVAKQIGDVAGAYGKTQNFIEVAGGQTVAVEVQFAEVSRSVTNSLGVNWGFSDGTAIFGVQPGGNGPLGFHVGDGGFIDDIALAASPGVADMFGRIVSGNAVFGYFIKALRENNLLRVLQQPNLTTTSGDPASFLAGGQVAVPVPTDSGTIGIEYKEFGIRLLLTPIVLGNGKIRLIMEAESSDLDYGNGTTISSARVPGLRTRRVQSSVEIGEGQTMSVAGLLDDSVIATRQSVPGLGDIPVLGQLFRSTRYQRKETELVILITPRLVGAMNPDQVTALPGADWRHPTELEQFAFGDMGGSAEADATRDMLHPESERGLKPEDLTPKTGGNPVSTGPNGSGDVVAAAPGSTPTKPAPPMFIGDHGFVPVREPTKPTTGSDTASARE